jgi:hypothetical protein
MFNLVEKVLCIEVLERISRMQRFLRLESDAARQQGVEVVSIFVIALNGILDNLKPIVIRLSEDLELDKWERLAAVRRLSDIMNSVDELHAQLQFIHGAWVRPETHVFVRSVLEFIPEVRRPERVSVILSNTYSFEESDLSSYFEYVLRTRNVTVAMQRETPTVFLPKIERDNPLNWTILVHECGHADYESISKLFEGGQIIPDQVDASAEEILRRWAEEIYCDIFATRVLGPAYLASFATFALVLAGAGGAEKASETHPADIVRVCIIREVLKKNNLKVALNFAEPWVSYDDVTSFFYGILEERTKLDRKSVHPTVGLPLLPLRLQDFVDAICEQIDELISVSRQLTPGDFSRIDNLAHRLAKGIPIGSYHNPELVQPTTEAFREVETNTLKFDQVRQAVQESRALLWEIVNAGWVHKIRSIYPKAFARFFTPSNIALQENIENWGEELEATDRLLLKSIESSEIHRLMEEV